MATIRKEMRVTASPAEVWDAFADVGAIHTRIAPGFVVDTVLEGDVRRVTFANGFVAMETIVSLDATRRRLAYAITGSALMTHHNAAFEIFPDQDGTLVVWQADLLPDGAAAQVGGMMEEGLAAMGRVFGTAP